MSSLIDRFRAALFDRNELAFNFFMAKPITQLECCRRLPHVIGFSDLQFLLQDDMECLKRYYTQPETEPRMEKLIGSYLPKLQSSTVRATRRHSPISFLCSFGGHWRNECVARSSCTRDRNRLRRMSCCSVEVRCCSKILTTYR